jgi:NAD(P)-dependent dehydrogenase (short-subunit alcohol dehydrogenase family)
MKRVLVTGATDGIGHETARQLLAGGMHVLVHGRNEAKATSRANDLASHITGAKVTPVWGDLSRMREVAVLADQVRTAAPVLDVLVNNAGIYAHRRKLTEDRFESTMAVNHFAPYLLTRLVGPLLSKSPAGRIITVSSMAHQSGDIDLDDLTFENGFDGYHAYATSKLANILFTRALATRLSGTSVTANCLHPGVIDTKLLHAGFAMKGAPVEQGARTSVYLATSEDVAGISGKYFDNCRAVTPSRKARDEQLAQALWNISEQLLSAYF